MKKKKQKKIIIKIVIITAIKKGLNMFLKLRSKMKWKN